MQERNARHPGGIAALGFAALGVVFGDIGTSPFYTLKTVLDLDLTPGCIREKLACQRIRLGLANADAAATPRHTTVAARFYVLSPPPKRGN
jgi:hypothetical protein